MANILSTNISSLFTYNSLKKDLGLANSITVKEYISYLRNSYLFFELQKFEFSIRKQLASPKKIYIIDPAFAHLSGSSFSMDKGRILENLVFIQLKRSGKEVYYYSNKNECDFVIKAGIKAAEAIQVSYVLNDKNREREINGLLGAMDRLGLREGLILTREQEEEFVSKGKKIKILPVWKWLLV